MSVSTNLWVLNLLCLTVSSNLDLAASSVHFERSLKVLHDRQGEIRSTAHHSWSMRSINCSWMIVAAIGEPVIISFSQFTVRCGRDWITITTSTNKPISLCGTQRPGPIELTGGNVTVTHHFFPRYAQSVFHLSYIKGSAPCGFEEFRCLTGHCVPMAWRCNGQSECLGEVSSFGSDERDCDDNDEDYDIYDRVLKATTSKTTTTTTSPPTTPMADEWWQVRKTPGVMPGPHNGTCGGVLHSFYGSFWPASLMVPPKECVWTVDPQDPRPLRLELQMLELGPGDTINITDQAFGSGHVIKTITCASNFQLLDVKSQTGVLSLIYHTVPASEGRGFNATYRIEGYCLPWEGVCGGSEGGCYTQKQRCDGHWDCAATGRDEEGCMGCPRGHFPCGAPGMPHGSGRYGGRPVCFTLKDRCNYQLNCVDGSDERECTICQLGTFHCDKDRCVVESWRCDGQADCKDGTDEMNCPLTLPRKVITAATVGSLVCGLLLVIAMGCTCKLYSLRTREYSMFAPISRQEAEFIQQQAPPSYGQLIAQGIIPPVEDFPTENPNETTSLSLRSILQLLRHDNSSSPRRRRRPRFVRRAVRRLRRWGLMPRPTPRPSQTAGSSSANPTETPAAAGSEPSTQASPGGSAVTRESTNQPLPQKAGLVVSQSDQQQQQQQQQLQQALPQTPDTAPVPLPASTATTTPAPVAPATAPEAARSVPVSVPPSSPSLLSIFHSLGLNISLFRPSPAPSPPSLPLSASPSFSSSYSEDEVLLIPLSEDANSDDDVPMLT
ncbi:low-density lipoprotein receptor-related protein 10 [Sardina pilchardus]|uniref:low-density lipoprotein receptor-related protein 10 n=1 Tax=Sardina pilchardus TaxID=27697 RepID=UPI002E0E2AAA